MTQRHVVFLQGMPSPFFSRIGDELTARGCKVTGINLCFGDWFFWRGAHTVNYRGSQKKWASFVGAFFDREKVTDLMLLGEQRAYHKLAVAEAQRRNIRVTVTDFGYLRPDWITLEPNGMSGNSSFPKQIAEIRKQAAGVPDFDSAERYANSFRNEAIGDLIYSFGNVLFFFLYPFYRRSVKRPNPFIYFPAMGIVLLRMKKVYAKAQNKIDRLFASGHRFFIFPLQLEHDFQIVAYSPFSSLEEPIRKVIESFARHADADAHLVVKPHPWDPGLKDWEKLCFRIARERGIEDRLVYINGGNLVKMSEKAAGMVTINSTSGISALRLGIPVKVMGQAVYDIEGLTYQRELDSFWKSSRAPDPLDVAAFMNLLAASVQIRGTFFSEPGLTAAVTAAVDRLFTGTVGQVVVKARVS